MSEVGSARKRGLRALLSVRSPVPSATARTRIYSWLGRTRRVVCVCRSREERERERKNEGLRERETNREGENENENGRGETEGDGSVSSRAGCCIGQVRVACDSWPVARVVLTMERGPWPPPKRHTEKERERGERNSKIGGVDSAEERKRTRGWADKTRSFSFYSFLLCLAFSSSKRRLYTCTFFSLSLVRG